VGAHRNPYNEPADNRDKWIPEGIRFSDKPEILYFVGCTESFRRIEIAQATVKILDIAGIDFTILGKDEQCCGSPLLRTGQTDLVKNELIPHNIEKIVSSEVSEVVTACAGCHQTLTNDYPKIYGKLPFEVLHISQYVNRLLKEGRITLNHDINKTVTYHDPCHLGRHTGVYSAPRNVLNAISGIKFVEMPRNRINSRCCGAGGGFKIAFNDKAKLIGSKRVKEAVATGADEIITTCPFCKTNLLEGSIGLNKELKTIDLVELLYDAIR
jgi:heterodisulfide reductase subunit D